MLMMTYSKTFDDHLIHFQAVFERLKTANIKIKSLNATLRLITLCS
jgi:hypothetical protein